MEFDNGYSGLWSCVYYYFYFFIDIYMDINTAPLNPIIIFVLFVTESSSCQVIASQLAGWIFFLKQSFFSRFCPSFLHSTTTEALEVRTQAPAPDPAQARVLLRLRLRQHQGSMESMSARTDSLPSLLIPWTLPLVTQFYLIFIHSITPSCSRPSASPVNLSQMEFSVGSCPSVVVKGYDSRRTVFL